MTTGLSPASSEAVEFSQEHLQLQVALGNQELLNQMNCRDERDTGAMAKNQLVSDRAEQMRLAPAWQAKCQDIAGILDEAALHQGG